MGFECRFLVLLPEKGELGALWSPCEEINFEHVTRLEKLSMPHLASSFVGRHRAAICFVNVVLHSVLAREETFARDHFAPPILAYESIMDRRDARGRIGEHCVAVDCGQRYPDGHPSSGRFPYPGRMRIAEHNAVLALPDDALARHVNTKSPVLDPPLRWGACREAVAVLDAAIASDAPAWQEACKDPRSRVFFNAWLGLLREFVAVDARILYVFPFLDY